MSSVIEQLEGKDREARVLAQELAKRRMEALRLYEPLPFQRRFHESRTKQLIMQKGNQVGGSLSGFVEDARAVTGQDPYDKYARENGTLVLLGFGERHIGRVMHNYLFRAGAFRIIRDLDSGEWRTYRPWDDHTEVNGRFGDKSREKEAKPAPPLIPHRFIEGGYPKGIAWEKKSERVFSEVRLTTGWTIYALNSAGDFAQAQGFQADLVHIDEDLATGGWLEEMIGRTMTRGGLIRWTALPHQRTDDIVQLIEDAEKEEADPNKTTERIKVTIYDNPFIPEESREAAIRRWKAQGEDVYRKRALGELTLDTVRMYPQFHKEIHRAISRLSAEERQREQDGMVLRHPVQKILTEREGQPAEDWCRYMVFDPGFTVGYVGFFAVPPPQLGEFKVLYDELYIPNCTAKKFGEWVEYRARDEQFREFIIDAHGGRLRDFGSGVLPKFQYEKELEKRRIECDLYGSRFSHGSDDVSGREMALRSWLEVRHDGWPTFLCVAEKVPHFCRTMLNFKKKMVKVHGKDVVSDEGNRRGDVHAAEVAEYAAAHGLPYHKPKKRVRGATAMDRIIETRKWFQRKRNRDSSNTISLGPKGASS